MEATIYVLFFFVAFILGMHNPAVTWLKGKKAFIYFGISLSILGIVISQGAISQGANIENPVKSQKQQNNTLDISGLSQEEKSLMEKYHIIIPYKCEPKVSPLWVREQIMKHIQNDFDKNFLTSVNLWICNWAGKISCTKAVFEKGEHNSKEIYRQFKVYSDGKVEEEYFPPLRVLQKYNKYASELYDAMIPFNEKEYDRLLGIEWDRLNQELRNDYLKLVKEYNNNQ